MNLSISASLAFGSSQYTDAASATLSSQSLSPMLHSLVDESLERLLVAQGSFLFLLDAVAGVEVLVGLNERGVGVTEVGVVVVTLCVKAVKGHVLDEASTYVRLLLLLGDSTKEREPYHLREVGEGVGRLSGIKAVHASHAVLDSVKHHVVLVGITREVGTTCQSLRDVEYALPDVLRYPWWFCTVGL